MVEPPNRRSQREQDFWGHHIPSLDESLSQYEAGPDPNTALMLDSVGPLEGARVLDVGCGAGATTAWLAARGAHVVGVDLSPESLARAQELLDLVGVEAQLELTPLESIGDLGPFDCAVGRYALHHMDVGSLAPVLAGLVRPGGKAAFVETFASNPLLRLSRRHLVGRLGIPRYGTLDEHPLVASDVEALRRAFGSARLEVGQMRFLRILERQVLRHRLPALGAMFAGVDDVLGRLSWARFLSYHQVVLLERL